MKQVMLAGSSQVMGISPSSSWPQVSPVDSVEKGQVGSDLGLMSLEIGAGLLCVCTPRLRSWGVSRLGEPEGFLLLVTVRTAF